MAKIQDEILESFFQQLSELEAVGAPMIAGLRKLLGSRGKPKVDDIAAVFAADPKASDDQ